MCILLHFHLTATSDFSPDVSGYFVQSFELQEGCSTADRDVVTANFRFPLNSLSLPPPYTRNEARLECHILFSSNSSRQKTIAGNLTSVASTKPMPKNNLQASTEYSTKRQRPVVGAVTADLMKQWDQIKIVLDLSLLSTNVSKRPSLGQVG